MRFLNNLSLEGNELRNAVIQVLATTPTSFNKLGRVYFDSRTDLYPSFGPVGRVRVAMDATGTEPSFHAVAFVEDIPIYVGPLVAQLGAAIDLKQNKALTSNFIWMGDVNGVAFEVAKSAVHLNEWGAPVAPVDMGGFRITNLADPLNPQDAVTKSYADALKSGMLIKEAVDLATTAALPAHAVSAPNAFGGTLTATANGALSIDGVAVLVNDRILVKNQTGVGAQTGAAMNGIYTVTAAGSGYAPWSMARADDADASGDAGSVVSQGITTSVLGGATNGGTQWALFTPNPIVLNTTGLDFRLTYQSQDLVAGEGLKSSGTQWDLDLYAGTSSVLGLYGSGVSATLGIKNAGGVGVIGQSPAGTDPKWILAATDGHVFKRTSGAVGFSQLDWGDLSGRPSWLTSTLAALSVLGNSTTGTPGAPTAITTTQPAAGAPRKMFLADAGAAPALKFSELVLRDLPDLTAKSILARSANTAGVMAALTATTVGDVLQLNASSVLVFAPLDYSVIANRIKKYAADITGTGAATSFVVTHSLTTKDLLVNVYDVDSPFDIVYVDTELTSTTTLTVRFGTAPANGKKYRVVVIA